MQRVDVGYQLEASIYRSKGLSERLIGSMRL
jgi:hypothetical protein